LIYQDYKINTDRSVLSLPYVKWILLYTLYLCVLTVIQGTIFNTFNNAFFVIHSVLFFLVVLIYSDKFKWIEIMVQLSILFVCLISIFTITTTIIFIITHTNLSDIITNIEFKTFLISVAPVNERLVGLMTNSNTYAYLIVYTFFIYLFLIIYYKKSKVKYLLILILVNNVFNLFITGSRGAILSFLISTVFFAISLIILMENFSYANQKLIKNIVFSIFGIFILLLAFIFLTNFDISIRLRSYTVAHIFRLGGLAKGSGRLDTWGAVFSIDKKNFIFGVNDSYMYQVINTLVPSRSSAFINNSGRYHNLYLTLFANYGIFALLGFLGFLIYSIVIIFKGYLASSFRRRRFVLILFSQFLVFLFSGVFEQLPLFNQSPHTLLFMFVWASTIAMSNGER